MRIVNLIFVSLLIVTVSGCGYTSSSLLPADLNSIHVNNFINKIDTAKEVSDKRNSYSYWPGLEVNITRAVIDGFIFDRHLDIERESSAALLLEGNLVNFRQFPLSYDGNDNVVEFRVEVCVDISLYNNKTGELMWEEKSFMGESDYNVTGQNAIPESQAVQDAVKDLAQRIVERTVEAW